MMHYSATENSYKKVRERGFLLVDSGGQYLDGTTDITRTISVGELTEEEKIDYTLTLKSHINLAMAKFLKGVTGYYLDILARKPMWDRGMDYKCGTGHGVGFFLSVHEGPQNISYRKNDTVLEPGMIVTNEPGVYKAGKHGIRTENMILVVEDKTTEFGEFLKFETISYCPIDTKPIVKEILAEEEINWLNEYHKMVFEKLSGRLNEEEREFLKIKTMEI
jgi:Xaa-Pro aminopeptidase